MGDAHYAVTLSRVMGSRAALLLVILGAAACGLAPSTAAAGSGGLCGHSGRVSVHPGLTTSPHTLVFHFTGSIGPCQLSDGSIRSGTESGEGTASGDCAVRSASGVWTIAWSSGTTTVVNATFSAAGNLVSTVGAVAEGEFAGGQFRDAHYLSGFDPTNCASSGGVTDASFQGVFRVDGS